MGVLGAISHGAGVVTTAALVLRAVVERLDRARRRNLRRRRRREDAGRPSANGSLTATPSAGGAASKDDVEGDRPTRPLEPGASSPPANDASGASSPAFATPASSPRSPRAADARPPRARLGGRVALYGLSANPPTNLGGHATIVRRLSKLFDEVWILPVFKHAYASKRHLAPYEDRRAMCELAFRDERDENARDNVRVIDVEKTVVEAAIAAQRFAVPSDSNANGVDPVVGSYDVLRWLRAAHPGMDFAWVMGGDAYRDLADDKWKDSALFRRDCAIVVVPRSETDAEELSSGGALGANARVLELSDTNPAVSSTAVREMLAARGAWRRGGGTGEWDGWDEFDPEVLEEALSAPVRAYIEERGLYGA